MNICSIEFVLFVTGAFILYWTFFSRNWKWQNAFLLFCSIVFYAIWDWRALGLLLITALITYVTGIINATDSEKLLVHKSCRWWGTLIGIVVNLCILGFFKYYNFFVESFVTMYNSVFHKEVSYNLINIILPVGISFYTFSAISYIVDTYKKDVKPARDIIASTLYLSFYPAILSGPIHKASKQLPQYFSTRKFDGSLIINSFRIILWGAFIKLCVADRLGIVVDGVYGNISSQSRLSVFLASIYYTIQIYADFAGYSLIAIGVARMFGIELQQNFNKPYLSKTITEFWKKWHISLTSWFRNYVYFPLGGNRVSQLRWMLNIMIVFLLSGLWHGAAISFLIWGGLHGIIQLAEKQIYGKRVKDVEVKGGVLGICHIILTFIIVNFAWVFFRLPFNDAIIVFRTMFTSTIDGINIGNGLTNIWMTLLFVFVLFSKELLESNRYVLKVWHGFKSLRWFVYYAIVICTVLFGSGSSESFIYYQF